MDDTPSEKPPDDSSVEEQPPVEKTVPKKTPQKRKNTAKVINFIISDRIFTIITCRLDRQNELKMLILQYRRPADCLMQ